MCIDNFRFKDCIWKICNQMSNAEKQAKDTFMSFLTTIQNQFQFKQEKAKMQMTPAQHADTKILKEITYLFSRFY